ncbi:MAG: hypothetical protein NVS2B12_07320 [Ktedonobacteraceae bacterium]
MQVPTDSHNFGCRAEVYPLLGEIVSHPAITISPLLRQLIWALIKAKQMPIALRGKRLLNEGQHLLIPPAIRQGMRKEI